jgi:hypothetical protein
VLEEDTIRTETATTAVEPILGVVAVDAAAVVLGGALNLATRMEVSGAQVVVAATRMEAPEAGVPRAGTVEETGTVVPVPGASSNRTGGAHPRATVAMLHVGMDVITQVQARIVDQVAGTTLMHPASRSRSNPSSPAETLARDGVVVIVGTIKMMAGGTG